MGEDTRVAVEINGYNFYHTVDLPDGTYTKGEWDHRDVIQHYGIPDSLQGKTAIDVGCRDGFFGFEMERRGAKVVALDVDDRKERRFLTEKLNSKITFIHENIYEFWRRGQKFDLVFCGDVLAHVDNPLKLLRCLHCICRGQLILAVDKAIDEWGGEWAKLDAPIMAVGELSYFWHFSQKAIEKLLQEGEWKHIRIFGEVDITTTEKTSIIEKKNKRTVITYHAYANPEFDIYKSIDANLCDVSEAPLKINGRNTDNCMSYTKTELNSDWYATEEANKRKVDILKKFMSCIYNRIGLYNEFWNSTLVSQYHPIRLQVYMTNKCNARCVMCHGIEGLALEKFDKDVTAELFFKTFGEHLLYAERCDLYGTGEVLLLKEETFNILKILQDYYITTNIVTSGTLLTPDVIDTLVSLSLSCVTISVDAVEKELYESIRKNLKWDILERNLKYLLSHDTIPRIEFNFVIMRSNVHHMVKLIDYVKSIHRNNSEIKFAFYFLDIKKKNDFFEHEVFYPNEQSMLENHFKEVKRIVAEYSYKVHLPPFIKLKESEAIFQNALPTELNENEKDLMLLQPYSDERDILLESEQGLVQDQNTKILNKTLHEQDKDFVRCSRPWDTYWIMPDGTGKICCYDPIPHAEIDSRNSEALQGLRNSLNDPGKFHRYPACVFCSERHDSEFAPLSNGSRILTLLPETLEILSKPDNQEVDGMPQYNQGTTICFPMLIGNWKCKEIEETPVIIACRDLPSYSDIKFKINPINCKSSITLCIEYIDHDRGSTAIVMIPWESHVRLGDISSQETFKRKIYTKIIPKQRLFNQNGDLPHFLYVMLDTQKAELYITSVYAILS